MLKSKTEPQPLNSKPSYTATPNPETQNRNPKLKTETRNSNPKRTHPKQIVDPVLGVMAMIVKAIRGLIACLPTTSISSCLPKSLQSLSVQVGLPPQLFVPDVAPICRPGCLAARRARAAGFVPSHVAPICGLIACLPTTTTSPCLPKSLQVQYPR